MMSSAKREWFCGECGSVGVLRTKKKLVSVEIEDLELGGLVIWFNMLERSCRSTLNSVGESTAPCGTPELVSKKVRGSLAV